MGYLNDHVRTNILYKDLSSPDFKEYYTLEEINEELMEFEGGVLEPQDECGQVLTELRFHMSYKSFLFTIKQTFDTAINENTHSRVCRFLEMARVKE